MFPAVRAGRMLAAVLIAGIPGLCAGPAAAGVSPEPDPAWRQAETVGDLVEHLEEWLDDHAPWPRRPTRPVVYVAGPDAAALRDLPTRPGHGATRGLYDAGDGTIVLILPWDRRDPRDVSVLLHELVHHRQAVHRFPCPGAQELPAYRLQEAWLAERGVPLDVNWIAVVLEAGCTPKDVHPD